MPNTSRSRQQAEPGASANSPLKEYSQKPESQAPPAQEFPSSLPAWSPDAGRYPAVGVGHGTRHVRNTGFHTADAEGEELVNRTTLLDAIYDTSPKMLSKLFNNMEHNDVAEVLTSCDFQYHDDEAANDSYSTPNLSLKKSLIAHACLSGNVEVFEVVLGVMETRLTEEQLGKTLTTSAAGTNETLVELAAKGGSQAVFEKVILLLDGELLETTVNKRRVGSAIVRDSAVNGDTDAFQAVTRILDKRLTRDKAMDAATTNREDGSSNILTSTLHNGSSHEIAAWAEVLTSALPYNTVAEACTTTFSEVCRTSPSQLPLDGMSVLIAYGADPPRHDLIHLSRVYTRHQLRHCFLGALTRVDNPMIPGLTLSIALGEAVKTAQGQQKLLLSSLRQHVGEMLLEVLDRLPQSVRDFTGGFRGCTELFEGGSTRVRLTDFVGPLQRALKDGHYDDTLCSAPLVADYIYHKFVLELPSCFHTDNDYDVPLSRKKEQQENLQRAHLVADSDLGKSIQGLSRTSVGSAGDSYGPDRIKPSADNWLDIVCDGGLARPGAQFIVVGVVSRPYSYYKVPAMRMALDFMVYLGVVTLFIFVIRQEDDIRDLNPLELFFVVYIADEIVSGIRTMWGDSFLDYWQDNWNWLNAANLFLLALSNLIRIVDHSDGTIEHSSSVHGLLALSAPLVFIRFLFFAQILRRQGLVIHTISLMVGELLQFVIVLLVVMMGFAMSLYALFHEASFTQIWLNLFEGILGDTSSFDMFASGPYEILATLLLVVYLVIMAIMLLNLLVAILSTAHDKVTENTERESRASKVRIARFYRRVVEHGVLPAPLNLVQLITCLPVKIVDRHWFRRRGYAKAKHAFGGTVFWLVSGPVAIVFGSILWIVWIPGAMARVWEALEQGERSVAFRVGRCCAVVPLYVVVAPLILVGLWLQAGWMGLRQGVTWVSAQVILLRGQQEDDYNRKTSRTKSNRAEPHKADKQQQGYCTSVCVSDMLELAPDGRSLREIWAGLDDSVTKLSVRRDEAGRPPTVQQIQILQRNLETSNKDEAGHVRANLASNEAAILARVDGLEQKLEMTLGNRIDKKMVGLESSIESSINEAVETRFSRFEEKLDKLLRELQQGGLE